MTDVLGFLSRLLVLGAVVFFIYVTYKVYDQLGELKAEVKKLRIKRESEGKQTNNDCDVCCRECDDKFECSGACIHAVKPEDCYKTPATTTDNKSPIIPPEDKNNG